MKFFIAKKKKIIKGALLPGLFDSFDRIISSYKCVILQSGKPLLEPCFYNQPWENSVKPSCLPGFHKHFNAHNPVFSTAHLQKPMWTAR